MMYDSFKIALSDLQDARDWAMEELFWYANELEYCNNYRIALVGNREEEEAYDEALAAGCCGYMDRVVTDPVTGYRFKIGCNFGH